MMTEKKRKTSFRTKLTSEDRMTPKQLKAYAVFNVSVEAVLIFIVFVIARSLLGLVSSIVLSVVLFLLVASLIAYRIEKKLRLKTSGQ